MNTQSNISRELAAFVAGMAKRRLPDALAAQAKLAILDVLASALGGTPTQNAALSRAAAAEVFGDGNSPVWFGARTMSKLGAVFSNCAAASALDIDDGHRGASGHAGAAVVPAVLAEAESSGADGEDILRAVVVGYDIALRIAAARRRHEYMSFASGRWAGYGVAAGVGFLRGLSVEELAHAMAIAGAEAPMNLPQGDYKTVSSVKGSSPWSAVTAVTAVHRAALGATGPADLLDRARVYHTDAIVRDLGVHWQINDIYFKPYASCRYTHPMIDAAVALRDRHAVDPRRIERVQIDAFPEAAHIPNATAPESLEAAQFSIPFTVALVLVHGTAALRPLTLGHLSCRETISMAQRIDLNFSDEFEGAFPDHLPSRVALHVDGNIYQEHVTDAWGDVSNPMDGKDIEQKFRDLGGAVAPEIDVPRIIDAVRDLDTRGPDTLWKTLQVPLTKERKQ